MSGARPVRRVALSCVKISAFGVNVSFTEHCLLLALNSATRSLTQDFLPGSSGQLLIIVICVVSAPACGGSGLSSAAHRAAAQARARLFMIVSTPFYSAAKHAWGRQIVNSLRCRRLFQ